jgi:HD-like signal output (HDOD) protein
MQMRHRLIRFAFLNVHHEQETCHGYQKLAVPLTRYHAALKRHQPGDPFMTNSVTLPIQTTELLAKIVRDTDLPAMSDIAVQLVATLSKEDVDLTYLRDLIARDPSLTASMLRWANSPIHGFARKINTLDGAITVLGISKIRACAIAFFITNSFETPVGVDRDVFWKSCMQSAGYAMWIALAVGLNESEAWLTAMMVRLGELVIGQIDRSAPQALATLPLPVQQRWLQQREKIGFDEGDVVSEVAKLWFFPDAMVEALHKCAKPMDFMAFSPLAAVLHLALILSDFESVNQEALQTLPADVTAKLGIQIDWLAQHIPEPAVFVA